MLHDVEPKPSSLQEALVLEGSVKSTRAGARARFGRREVLSCTKIPGDRFCLPEFALGSPWVRQGFAVGHPGSPGVRQGFTGDRQGPVWSPGSFMHALGSPWVRPGFALCLPAIARANGFFQKFS